MAEARKPNRRPLLILGLLIALVLLAIGGRAFLNRGRETTDDAQVEADVVAIAPQIGGQVLRVLVSDNQAVKKGALILELDDGEAAARLAQAGAELQHAEAEERAARAQEQIVAASAQGGLHTAKAVVSGSALGVSSAASQIEVAEAQVTRAEGDAKRAALELDRSKRLFAQNSIPREELDNAQITSDSAQAALAQAKAVLHTSRDAKSVAQSRVAEAQGRLAQSAPVEAQLESARAATELAAAHVKSAQAALHLAELELSHCRVLSPADGIVSKLNAHDGQLVGKNQPVAELVPSRTYVMANFKETQVGRMRPGQRAELEIDAYPARVLEGVVESLSGATGARFSLLPPDNASGNFVKVVQRVPVRIALSQVPSDIPLRAGLSAEATVYVR
ncbi:MAG TPA: HlyD family secretion protein [Polyangiaceae bacterium]|nr:HlyD family secretion protein [Polyangiaceae bacterium]